MRSHPEPNLHVVVAFLSASVLPLMLLLLLLDGGLLRGLLGLGLLCFDVRSFDGDRWARACPSLVGFFGWALRWASSVVGAVLGPFAGWAALELGVGAVTGLSAGWAMLPQGELLLFIMTEVMEVAFTCVWWVWT